MLLAMPCLIESSELAIPGIALISVAIDIHSCLRRPMK